MPRLPRPRTLLWRLGLGLMLSQSVVAAVFGAWADRTLRAFNREQVAAELERLSPLVTARFDPFLAGPDLAAIDQATRETAAATGLRVTIVEPGGRVLSDSDDDPATMDNHRYRPEIDGALPAAVAGPAATAPRSAPT